MLMLKNSMPQNIIILSLIAICLNANFRTIEGFCKLIANEWGSYQIKALDMIDINGNKIRFSVAFVVFLHCLYQVIFNKFT